MLLFNMIFPPYENSTIEENMFINSYNSFSHNQIAKRNPNSMQKDYLKTTKVPETKK